ncbi:MAG: cytochrome P450 [Leptolyngbya sp.]|nr:cytochrome P450 [Leptolyngbya sp.]
MAPMSSIPTPPTPQVLQLINWILDPLAYMDTNQRRLGDLFRIRPWVLDWLLVSHPDSLRYLLTHDTQELSAPGEVNAILKPLLGEHSVITLSGDPHRTRRKLIMPPFHGDRLKVYGDLMQRITHEVMATVAPGDRLMARETTQKISMRVILQTVFGLYQGERYQRLETLLKARLDMMAKPVASTMIFFPILQRDWGKWSPGHKIQAIAAEIDAILLAEIRERRANPHPNRTDILSLLLLAQDEQGQGLSDQELRDELMTLLVAGHETTATAMAWGLYWAHRLPQVQQSLQAELTSHPNADPMGLTKLPYLSAFCNETLRLYPVAMLTFARQAQQPFELEGYPIAAGEVLVGCIYRLHRREDLYPQAQEFRPERFLERQYSAFEFMPFGAGARRCIGSALAMMEMKIVLGTLLQEYDLALTSHRPALPQRRGITLGLKDDVELVVRAKRSPQPSLVPMA